MTPPPGSTPSDSPDDVQRPLYLLHHGAQQVAAELAEEPGDQEPEPAAQVGTVLHHQLLHRLQEYTEHLDTGEGNTNGLNPSRNRLQEYTEHLGTGEGTRAVETPVRTTRNALPLLQKHVPLTPDGDETLDNEL